ncbi:hypothetical protein [Arthrobacter sp. W4I7]|uniref:hypothetical protein n=1 Tax=Arthrobacter sp. W4I7 TaxID=3042296 RepID=UPI0027869F0A|nr:hypothetical protein [Arthrobacter sp. W4I7]MDQ0690949.1 hypothetical protein [Arthrobacter sp. W4I7]
MREPWLFIFGAVFVTGAMSTLQYLRTVDRRTKRLGWEEAKEKFDKRRHLQFAACIAAGIGIFVTVAYWLGLPAGAGRTSELALVLILVSVVWAIFRRDIARYQYRVAMTMFGRRRPEQEQEQHQIGAMESVGVAFSALLFITGILLLALNLAFVA